MNRNNARLLVVDDNHSMRTSITNLLHELGCLHIDEADDGDAALTLFWRTPYDVVITDWQLPEVSGLELLRAIRTGPERRDTPVLVVTGRATTADVWEAFEAGASGLVAKAFIDPSLSDNVLRLLAERPPVSELVAAPALGDGRSPPGAQPTEPPR